MIRKFAPWGILGFLMIFPAFAGANPFLGKWKFNSHTLTIHRNTYITFTQSGGYTYGTLSGGTYSGWNSFVGTYNRHQRKLIGTWKTHNGRHRYNLPGSFYFSSSRSIAGVFSTHKMRVTMTAYLIKSHAVRRCKGGSVWNGSSCVCNKGKTWNGKRCVCSGGSVWNGSVCTCTGGSYWSVNRCICPAGRHWNGVKCKKSRCRIERVCRTEKVQRCKKKRIGETCEYKKICKIRHGKRRCKKERECRPDYRTKCRYVDQQV
ncbi:hypothetical protein KJ865_09510, partial [Myxococcota bacterium]|nr:hypothetical protein [Myxococcota bacterium]